MTDYFSLMMSFAKDAGDVALGLIHNSHPGLKADTSVITEADRTISSMAHERLAGLLSTGKHLLIEEEDPRKIEYLDQAILEGAPFIWSVDPIDGTRAYANQMLHYGISIGLVKDLKPWMGVVYFPSLGELFCCDGQEAYYIQHPFTPREVRTRIVPIDEEITSRSVFIASDEILNHLVWDEKECRVMIFATAVCEFCWPTIGRGCGSLSMVHLWDFVGSWPIFEKAGLKLRSLEDGKVLDKIDAGLFHKAPSPWRLKDYYILSSERNYPILKSSLRKV